MHRKEHPQSTQTDVDARPIDGVDRPLAHGLEDPGPPPGGGESDPVEVFDAVALSPWRPRANAQYLTRGPSGIWYVRFVVPQHIRAARPDLPREIKRSTRTAKKRLAETRAKKMCLDYLVRKINSDSTMSPDKALESKQGFAIVYEDGAVRAELAQGASSETLLLMTRCMHHFTMQIIARASRSPNQALFPGTGANAFGEPSPKIADDQIPATGNPEPPTLPYTNRPSVEEPPLPAEEKVWLSDAIEEWLKSTKFSPQTWTYSYAPSFRIFRELIGNQRNDRINANDLLEVRRLDINIRTLSRAHVQSFHKGLTKLPARQGKRDDGVEALRRIELAAQSNAKPMSDENIEKKLEHVRPFLDWCVDKGYVSPDVCKELRLVRNEVAARISMAKSANVVQGNGLSYVAFSLEELKRIFEQPAFLIGAIRDDWAYWCPLLCLLEALRIAEASQIHARDLLQVDGVWCLRVTTTTDPLPANAKARNKVRRLKTGSSRRTVPVHPLLIELGFIEYVQAKLKSNSSNDHLFPALRWHEKDLWSRQPREHLGELIRLAGAYQPRRKVPHSLRSNLHQAIKRTGLAENHIQRLLGHSTKTMADSHYSEAEYGAYVAARLVFDHLRQVEFGISVPAWHEIERRRAPYTG